MSFDSIPGSAAVSRMGITICLGAFVLAYNSVCLTNVASLLQIKNNLSQQQLIFQLSVATSCFNVGTIISPIFYRKFLKKFGELNGITLLDLIGTIIIFAELSQLTFWTLAVCRALLGLVIGISTSIISVFLNSISPHQIYARIGCYAQTLQTIGVSAAYILSYILRPHDETDQFLWRVYLGFPAFAFILRSILLRAFYPFNSIQTHIKCGQTEKLKEYCLMVYHKNDQKTLEQLIEAKSFERISETNKETWRRRFIVALVVIASNQFSGINGILFYAKQLFNKITAGREDYTQIIMVLLSLMQIVSTLLSSQIADLKGRRKMLLGGQFTIAVILMAIFLSDFLLASSLNPFASQIMVIMFVFVHVLVMNFTLGNLCIVYCAQIVEDITWIVITLKVCSFIVALTTQYMIEYLGIGLMFLIFFILTFIAHLYLRKNLLETKGLSTAEIYSMFSSSPNSYSKIQCDKKQQTLLIDEERFEEDQHQNNR